MASLAEALANRDQGTDAARHAYNNAHGWAGIARLDQAVERAKADPGYLATLQPHERSAIERRMANLAARTPTDQEGTK